MSPPIKTSVAALAILAVVAIACSKTQPEPSPTGVRVGEEAPAFTLPSAGGPEVSLADFMGRKPVLLYFSMGPG